MTPVQPPRPLGAPRRLGQAQAAPAWGYPAAAAAIGAAFLVKIGLPSLFGPPYILFYPTVMVVAVMAGLGPGLLATALAALLAALWILPAGPEHQALSVRDLVGLASFVAGCALMSAVAALYRRAHARILELEKVQALQETEARTQAIFDQVGVGIAELDPDTGRFLRLNQQLADLLGYPRDELVGRGWTEVTHPDEVAEDREHLARLGAGQVQGFSREKRYLAADGRVVWARVSTSRTAPDETGRFTFIAAHQDVTERHQAEDARQESDRRLATIFRLALTGFLIVRRRDRAIVDANDAWLALVGWPREEVIGRTTLDLALYADPAQREEIFRALEAGDPVRPREIRVRSRSGEVRDVLITAGPVDLAGEACVLAVWQDLTTLHRADEEVRRSEARFRALTERASDMVSVFGADGRVLFWSPAATEQLGWTAEEMRARTAAELTHPDDSEATVAGFARLAGTPGAVAQIGLRFRHRDGSWRRLETVSRNLLHDPDVRGIVVNGRDVTQHRSLEDQLRQAQKLESIGRLAGGVAHDFNNLLTVILSCSEGLKEDLAAGRPASSEDVEEIHAAGERARDLTRQLLAFARKQVIAPVPLDLNTVVRGSEKLLRRVLGEDVKLVVDVQAGLWPVLCDQGQLEQTLLNLVVNARDAMPQGGTLTLQTRNVAAGAAELAPEEVRPGDWVRLVVRDTGVGISAEVRSHLFEPFFTTKGVGKGTGLGLATVHGVVAQSGGHIHVDSEPGQGSAFVVWLPRSRGQIGARPPAAIPSEARGTETVLVVEDDAPVRAVTVRALEGAGYLVIASASGAEALDLAGRHPGSIQLVVSDVVMPGMSGQAVVEELQARRPGLPALFVSGYAQDAIDDRGPIRPGGHLLQKPFTAATLLAEVRRALDGKPPGPPAGSRFAWSPVFEIGDADVDGQHRSLFEAAGRFEAALLGDEPSYRLQDLFDFLAAYATTHFEAEERLMARVGYPGLEAHRQEHRAFGERLGALLPRFGPEPPSTAACAVLLDFLHGWLTRHVGGSDRRLAGYLREAADPLPSPRPLPDEAG